MRIVLLLALVASCKSEPATAHRGSCQSSPTQCEDYESKDKKFVAGQKAACKGVGTWSDAPCPTANLLGSCRESHGWSRTRHHYAGSPLAIDRVKVECGAYGTWIEPAAPK
jgi:hypothetical protein